MVVAEAAIRGTPAVGFDVPGLRDSVVNGRTGVLVATEGDFASAWASLALNHQARQAMGEAAREHAERLHWSLAVEGFARVADDAIARAGRRQGRLMSAVAAAASTKSPSVPASSGQDRARRHARLLREVLRRRGLRPP